MLSIISMNRAGLSDGCLSVKVDFEFDNASTLPERVITVSGMSYIIAKDSTAKNTVTNVNYKYNGSKWVKVTETVEPVTSGTITDNGDYTITSNEYTGLSDITVDVADSSTFMDKTITKNGTYNASDDNVDGYSSVTANVPPYLDAFYFNDTYKRNGAVCDEQIVILRSDTGVYNIPELIANISFATTSGTLSMILLNPVKNIIGLKNAGIEYVQVYFTPASDYEWTDVPDVTPNDGKKYVALCTYGQTIKQEDNTNEDFGYQMF